jgi:mycoredoxin
MKEPIPVIVYTTSSCGDCRAVKAALERLGVAYVEVDIERDQDARRQVEALNDGRRSVPTLVHGAAASSLSRFSITKLHAFLADAGLA